MPVQDIAPRSEKKSNNRKPLEYDPRAEIVREVHMPMVVGLSLSTIWRLRRAGKFPTALRLGENSIGFRRVDIERWLESRHEQIA